MNDENFGEKQEEIEIAERILPILWKNWDEGGGYGDIVYYDVTFTDNFGPFSKGDKVKCLNLFMMTGQLIEYDDSGVQLCYVDVKLTPV